MGCAAKIGEVGAALMGGGGRRGGPWASGPIDLGVGVVLSATVRVSVNLAERAMAGHVAEFEVLGPWSLQTSVGAAT